MQVNHKVVQRMMQTYDWSCQVKMKKAHRPGSAYFRTSNLIDRKFYSKKPLEKITTDITYFTLSKFFFFLICILKIILVLSLILLNILNSKKEEFIYT